MEQVEINGLRIVYERAGAGPPLVLLHGLVGDGRSTWQRQLDDLSDEFTVVAWDGPGAGRSADPPASFRLPDYADCLAGFVNALGLTSPHVAGFSFGGALALELYHRWPRMPKSLTLAGAYAGWGGSLPLPVVEHRLWQSLRSSELPAAQFVAAMLPTMFSTSAPGKRVEAFAASVAEFHPAGFRTMALASAEADLRDVLPRIDVPTLLLHGDEDARAPRAVADALHASIPSSRLVVMTEVGHMSSVEAAERFIEELRRFLHEGVNGHYPGMVPAGSPPKSSASSSDSPCGSSSRASGRRSGSPRRSGPRRASADIAVEIGAVLPFSMARRHHDQPVQREREQATTRGWVAVADAAGHPWP